MIVRRQGLSERGSTSAPDPSATTNTPPTPRRARRYWEHATYWLLYVVAFGAAVLHWRAGNEALALLCAVAVLVSVRCIMRAYRASH